MIVFRIKQIRESKNITAYRLAKDVKISRSYLSELENNKKTPDIDDVSGAMVTSNAIKNAVAKYLEHTSN